MPNHNLESARSFACSIIVSVLISVACPSSVFAKSHDQTPYRFGMSPSELLRLKGPALSSEKYSTGANFRITLRYARETFYFNQDRLIYWSKSSDSAWPEADMSIVEHQQKVSDLLDELMNDQS